MTQVKIYLPDDRERAEKIVNEYLDKGDSVTISKENGQVVAVVDEKQKLEIHPATGLPILHD